LIVLFLPYGIVGTWKMKSLNQKLGWERLLKIFGAGDKAWKRKGLSKKTTIFFLDSPKWEKKPIYGVNLIINARDNPSKWV